jgi:hypothetical protein
MTVVLWKKAGTEMVRQDRRCVLATISSISAGLACLFATASLSAAPVDAAGAAVVGWKLEPGVDPPSYAVIDPTRTNLNVDSVVLACEEIGDGRGLQLQLYLSTEGPLAPKGVLPRGLKDEPRAEIEIDGRGFPAGLYFADDYVVLADEIKGMFPVLSDRLLDAMESGRTMVLRFDLLSEPVGQPASVDGELVIGLQAGRGGAAVATVRRCAEPATDRRRHTVVARH